MVSSPGSGKTSILERTLTDLKSEVPFYVIEGDQKTMNDANRIDALDIPVIQINTGKGCHLESDMVYEAIQKLSMVDNSVLMIENIVLHYARGNFTLSVSKMSYIITLDDLKDL